MREALPIEITDQVSRARDLIERHLAETLQAMHVFGSALDGGLKPYSDIDLLVTVSAAPDEPSRRALMRDLLAVSAPPGSGGPWRPLEVTVVVRGDIAPWRYPARRQLQFGEWLRDDLVAGVIEPAVFDHDLAILLTKVRQHSIALLGSSAAAFFEAVPERDFYRALSDTLAQWNSESDWTGDERNVALALARIWYSASTGRIAPKDVAAAWAMDRLPIAHRPLMREARAAYLGDVENNPAVFQERMRAFVPYAKSVIGRVLSMRGEPMQTSALRAPHIETHD